MKNTIQFAFETGIETILFEETNYFIDETSLMLDTERPTTSLMLGHQYLSIEVDCETHAVLGLSGFYRLDLCREKALEKRASEKDGSLIVMSSEKL